MYSYCTSDFQIVNRNINFVGNAAQIHLKTCGEKNTCIYCSVNNKKSLHCSVNKFRNIVCAYCLYRNIVYSELK